MAEMRLWALPLLTVCLLAATARPAAAQVPAQQWAAPPPPMFGAPSAPPPPSRVASDVESATLYGATFAYGIGIGVWIDAEVGLDDPALLLIPPTLLGVAAPITAYVLNHPTLPRGVPGAIATGLVIGASAGLGIASLQMVTNDHPWGFHGLARSMAIGSTAGGVAGLVVGELQRPSPNISAFASSGVVWGSLIGSAFGLGASPAGVGFGRSNDWMARGGVVGFSVGLAATVGLSTVFVPTLDQLSWMWAGAGIGALISLPVYLFYLGDGPPMKRGLVFSATATTLGIVAGGVFGPEFAKMGSLFGGGDGWARIDYVTPVPFEGGFGFSVGGSLF
jgi:hypothetical protein